MKKDYQTPQIEIVQLTDIITQSGTDIISGGGTTCQHGVNS